MPFVLAVCEASNELTLAFRPFPITAIGPFSAPAPSEYWRWCNGGGEGLDRGITRTEGTVPISYEYCLSPRPIRDGFCRTCPIVALLRVGIVMEPVEPSVVGLGNASFPMICASNPNLLSSQQKVPPTKQGLLRDIPTAT